MRALFLERGQLSLRDDLPEPVAPAGWSTVAVRRAGICATDQALARGYMGFCSVPGHEFVGVALDGPLRGQRVVGEINAGCGECAVCRSGDSRHCATRTVLGIAGLGGAFAERIVLPDRNLLAVPDAVDDVAATFTEPLAAALHIVDDVDQVAGREVLVAGDGKLGLLCALALAAHGARVTVAGRHPQRAALLPDDVTFRTGLLEPGAPPGAERARFHLAVEATGSPQTLPRLLPLVQPRGTIVLKTTTEEPTVVDLSGLVVDEQRLLGSRCGRFDVALDALARGAVAVAPLVAASYPLREGAAAFARAAQRGVLKVLLTFD